MSEYVWIYDNRQGSECLIWYIFQSHSTRYSELIERWAYSEPCQRSKIQHWGKNFFVNMKEVWICWNTVTKGFWIFQGSKYARFLHKQVLQKVLNVWIWLNDAWLWQGSECLVKVSQISEYARVGNMARFWICEAYAGAEYAWINLNMP